MGESTRGGLTPSRKGGLGYLPRENFQIQDVCRSNSEAFFACETRLIVLTLHDALFKLVLSSKVKTVQITFFRQPYICGDTLDHMLHHNAAMSYW